MPAATSLRRPVRLLTAAVVLLIILATFGPDAVAAWPSPRYECYCANCYDGYFVCRNRDYSCNCAACSCYSDTLATDEQPPRDKHGNDDDDDDDHNDNNTVVTRNVGQCPT